MPADVTRSASALCSGADGRQVVGDPVDVVTGAVVDRNLDFRLAGPLCLEWVRHYDSSKHRRRFELGPGHAHDLERTLAHDLDGVRFTGPLGRTVAFPGLSSDGAEAVGNGLVLRRVTETVYHVFGVGQPTMHFDFRDAARPATLGRLFTARYDISFEYAEDLTLRGLRDSAGRRLRIERGGDPAVFRIIWAADVDRALLTYEFDAAGNLARLIDAYRNTCEFRYDAASRLVSQRDRRGYTFYYEYDGSGRCTHSFGEDGLHDVRLRYEPEARRTLVTRADGGEWTYEYDDDGRVTTVRDPQGGVRQWVADDSGRITTELDENGNASRIEFGRAGTPIARISPTGQRQPLPEDPNAPDPNVRRIANCAIEWDYGQLIDRDDARLPTTAELAALDVPNAVGAVLRPAPAPDPAARQPRDAADALTVPPLGPAWFPAPPAGREFSVLGKLVRQQDDEGRSRRWSYDQNGNASRYTDYDGSLFLTERASWNMLAKETDPIGATTIYDWSRTEQLSRVTDAGGTVSEYAYDPMDRLIEVRRHGIVRERYERDAAGRLLRKRDGNGNTLLENEIGASNLIVRKQLAAGPEYRYQYDDKGRAVAIAFGSETLELTYDAIGRLTADKRDGAGVEHVFRTERELRSTTILDRFVVAYRRTRSGDLIITDPTGRDQRIEFLGGGLLRRTLSNGSIELAQYGYMGRCLAKARYTSSRQTTPRLRVYQYSGEGDLLLERDSGLGERRYEYDAAHRLRRSVSSRGERREFAYDAPGNLIRQPGLDATVGSGNRLATLNGAAVAYNSRDHVSALDGPGGSEQYEYDARDMLVRVRSATSEWKAAYDPLGRRTRTEGIGGTTTYHWDADRLIAEEAPDGRLRVYVYAAHLSLTPFMFVDFASRGADPASGQRYFVFSNQIATPVWIEDDGGREVWSAEIEPYGQAHIAPTSRLAFHLRFPGHYHDVETGLHYNRFRVYSPRMGRYLQSDPLGITGGINLYAYPASPLAFVDVRGLVCEECEKKAAAAAGDEDEEGNKKARCEHEEQKLNEQFGEVKDPTKVKDHEKNPDGSVIKNPDLQEVKPGEPPNLDPNKQWLWLVDQDGRLLVGAETPVGPPEADGYQPKLGHPTLVDGQPARMGGELKQNPDGSWSANNNSGRYSEHPDRGPEQLNNVNDRFKEAGTPMGPPKDNPNRRLPKT